MCAQGLLPGAASESDHKVTQKFGGQGEILISQEISWGSKMASPFFLSYVLVNNNKKSCFPRNFAGYQMPGVLVLFGG